MGVERLDDGDDPTQPPDADAGRSGEVPSSRDAVRTEDHVPDSSPPEPPADIEDKPAEPRTRDEYADQVAPPASPPIEDNSPKLKTQGLRHPRDELPEMALPEEDLLGESPISKRQESEQPQSPANAAVSADRSAVNNDVHTQVPGRGDSTTDGIDEISDDANRLGGDTAEEPVADPQGTSGNTATADSELNENQGGTATPDAEEQEDSWQRRLDPSGEDLAWPSREQRAEHITVVLDRIKKAGEDGLSAEDLHTVDPAQEIWSIERTLQHGSLLADMYDRAAAVPCEHKAIIAGGLSGAGKSTVLTSHPEIDRSQYLTINPDDIKEEMARRKMIPEVEGLSPMEASDLVHEESSYLARQLALRAQADGKNLIWDVTMSDLQKTEKRIQDLREAGYTRIDGIFIDIPIETSLRRTEERYWADQDKWFAGQGIGGRLIPPDVILRQRDDEWGSCNRKTFETIKQTFENWELRDNSVDDRPSELIKRGHKER